MEDMGSGKNNTSKARKTIRRRSHTRRAAQDCFVNKAEARREIVNSLQLHRSSSSSSWDTRCGPSIVGNGCNYTSISNPTSNAIGNSLHCTSILNTLPLPEPTWSTTEPSILATPPPPFEALEFERAENVASSYTWWLGFLNSLDVKNSTEVSKYPFEENIAEGNSGQWSDGSKLSDLLSMDSNNQTSCLDEWLTIPTSEDQGEMM